jgi:Tol biopolymer transport system component
VPSKWAGPFALSADGNRIIYVTRDEQSVIQRVPFDLARQELAAAPAPVFSGSFELRDQTLSPDGDWILFTNEDQPQQLHLVRPGGAAYRQLTTGGDRNRQGTWSPKGDWIVFQTTRGESSLAAIRPDGGGWQPIPVGPGFSTPSWSPDGSTIAAFNTGRGGFLIDVSKGLGAPVMRQLPPVAPGVMFWPIAWSPDGALLAGGATRAGQRGNPVVYSIAEGAYREVSWTRDVRNSLYSRFVDRQRLLVITAARELRLGDVRGTKSKLLYAAPAGHLIDSLAATRDGGLLTWIDRKDESDIWLMTLDEAGRGAKGDVRR